MIVPVELLNSIFIFYVDKNVHPHKENNFFSDESSSPAGDSSPAMVDDHQNRTVAPPFNLKEAMNTSFNYFHNTKFQIGSSVMCHIFNAFPIGVSITKVEEARFGNSMFVVLFGRYNMHG